jgi:hypothetical protein
MTLAPFIVISDCGLRIFSVFFFNWHSAFHIPLFHCPRDPENELCIMVFMRKALAFGPGNGRDLRGGQDICSPCKFSPLLVKKRGKLSDLSPCTKISRVTSQSFPKTGPEMRRRMPWK